MADLKTVVLPAGTVRYRDSGQGIPLVFVHGLLVDGTLWRKVVPLLESEFRCVVPDWPLGSHTTPMNPDADLSPPGQARIIADFIGALGLDGAVVIANDTGGAITQIFATEYPDRLAGLVLTPCDAFDNFLPPLFRPLEVLARVPGSLRVLMQAFRVRRLRRLPIAFGWVTKRPVPDEVVDGWMRPFMEQRGVRRDTQKLLRGVSRHQTRRAAEKLATFGAPALIAWAPEDRLFPFEHGSRLAELIPGGQLERIEDSYTFVSEDQPERVAQLVREFVTSRIPAQTGGA
jgi:pimeloyl-ACP methyl ester carboxylesterase